MGHSNDMRSVDNLVDRYLGSDYDKIIQIANNLDDLLELLAHFRLHQAADNVDSNFVFLQPVLSGTWVINHNMAKFPSVAIIDDNGELMDGVIDHVDTDNLTITFSQPVKGKATLN